MKTSKGFTIVELVIAVAIFVTIAGSIAYAFLKGLALNEQNRHLIEAVSRLQQKVEEIKNYQTLSTFDEMRTAYNGKIFQLTGFLQNRGTIEVLNVAGVPPGELYRLSVELSWHENGGHVIGEDTNLDGVLDAGEDLNGNGRLDSPAQIVTYLGP